MSAIQPKVDEPVSDELTLVQAAKSGDVSACEELVRRYDRNVCRIAQHITQNREDAEGLSTEETADALDLSIPAVKSRLLRARLQLRERLSRYFQRRDGGNGAQKHESGDGIQ